MRFPKFWRDPSPLNDRDKKRITALLDISIKTEGSLQAGKALVRQKIRNSEIMTKDEIEASIDYLNML